MKIKFSQTNAVHHNFIEAAHVGLRSKDTHTHHRICICSMDCVLFFSTSVFCFVLTLRCISKAYAIRMSSAIFIVLHNPTGGLACN